MSGLRFRRRVGAAADVAELEYIIALHQTCPVMRENATVSSRDVMHLLMSRYKLQITHKQAVELVRSLAGGGDTEADDDKNRSKGSKRTWKDHLFNTKTSGSSAAATAASAATAALPESFQNATSKKGNGLAAVPPPPPTTTPTTTVPNDAAEPSTSVPNPPTGTNKHSSGQKEETLPSNYLDLVQVLSVLLIPTFARVADEFKNGTNPEPYVEDIDVHRLFKLFTRPVDKIRGWNSKRKYSLYERHRPEPHGELPSAIQRLWMERAGCFSGVDYCDDESIDPPRIDEAFVKKLLLKFGEFERAKNPVLICEMVQAAQSTSGCLDEEAVANCISCDLGDWKVGSEDEFTTHFQDVFGTPDQLGVKRLEADEPSSEVDIEGGADPPSENLDNEETPREACCPLISCLLSSLCWVLTIFWCYGYCSPKREALFNVEPSNIDMVIDTHYSVTVVVLVWVFLILTFAVYMSITSALPELPCEFNNLWCQTFETIYTWAVLGVTLCLLGLIFVIPISFGNNPLRTDYPRVIFALFAALVYTVLPFAAVTVWQRVDPNWQETEFGQLAQAPYFDILQDVCFAIGILLSFCLFVRLSYIGLEHIQCFSSTGDLARWLFSSSATYAEVRIKRAATRKLNSILLNAYSLHSNEPFGLQIEGVLPRKKSKLKTVDQAINNYVLRGESFQNNGGVFWTWRRIINGSLFEEEGVWLHSRLIWFQVAQVFLAVMFSWMLHWAMVALAEQAATATDDLNIFVPKWYRDLIPTPYMIYASLYPAWIASMVVSLLLILIYIPSTVATVLKFRCQVYPSLKESKFNLYRQAVDLTYMNSANALWGLLGSTALFFILIGVIIFLFLWPPTMDFMLKLLGWCIGLGITVVLKMMFSKLYRAAQYRSFYRIHPQAAVMTSLAMECWYIVVGGSFLICRIGQFLFAAAFWVGRIDCQFLSTDVQLAGYQFDYVPIYYVKDILVHEAHRHPFLERLAQLYLMKLRYRDFVSDAGAVWRQLAVMALFPWLTKYRVFSKERQEKAKEVLTREDLYQKRENPMRLGKRFSSFDPPISLGDGTEGIGNGVGTTQKSLRQNQRKSSIRFSNFVEPRYGSSSFFQDCDSDEFADASEA